MNECSENEKLVACHLLKNFHDCKNYCTKGFNSAALIPEEATEAKDKLPLLQLGFGCKKINIP